ncbi:MAG: hypothetical protein KDC35_16715 [Acidobacteria bacterium]|nr:hypothetical protein [Acidobacteriota bacterium]
MTCHHLIEVEQAIQAAGIRETYRGKAWSKVHEFVYFDCVMDLVEVRRAFALESCVVDHVHRGTHDGCEQGLFCETCKDGVMGLLPDSRPGMVVFP